MSSGCVLRESVIFASMRRHQRLKQMWSVTLVLLAAVTLAAQNKPDFSGRWILVTPRQSDADIPSTLSVRQTLVRTTVQGDPMQPFFSDIAVDRQFESRTQSDTYTIGVQGGVVPGRRADGSPTGPQTRYSVKWEGNSLVFESGSYAAQGPETGVWAERRETWSLADGRLRVVVTTRGSADDSRTVTLVYRRP
jgi:hypothetical protein